MPSSPTRTRNNCRRVRRLDNSQGSGGFTAVCKPKHSLPIHEYKSKSDPEKMRLPLVVHEMARKAKCIKRILRRVSFYRRVANSVVHIDRGGCGLDQALPAVTARTRVRAHNKDTKHDSKHGKLKISLPRAIPTTVRHALHTHITLNDPLDVGLL